MSKIDKKTSFLVIGSGSMGSAIMKTIFDSGFNNITMYGIDKNELLDLSKGKNSKYFNNLKLPIVKTTSTINKAIKEIDYIFIVVPSIAMENVVNKIKNKISKKTIIVNCSKGFYPKTKESIHFVLQKIFNKQKVVSLTGPSHAEEVVIEKPTNICSISKKYKDAKKISNIFAKNKYFKVTPIKDLKGALLCGSYKNVLAIFCGFLKGKGFGINSESLVLVKGLEEMKNFVIANGGKAETVIGICGLGDLIATATSPLSRNFQFGLEFSKNEKKALTTKKTVEGLISLESIYKISKSKNISTPYIDCLYELWKNKTTFENVKDIILNKNNF